MKTHPIMERGTQATRKKEELIGKKIPLTVTTHNGWFRKPPPKYLKT